MNVKLELIIKIGTLDDLQKQKLRNYLYFLNNQYSLKPHEPAQS